MTYAVGQKIRFKSEKKPYRIIACDARYLICVKPFNLKRTYLYTIVDLVAQERGPENLIFGDYVLDEVDEADRLLADLQSGKVELSGRRSIDLDLDE